MPCYNGIAARALAAFEADARAARFRVARVAVEVRAPPASAHSRANVSVGDSDVAFFV